MLPCARPHPHACSCLLQFQPQLANFNSPAFHVICFFQALHCPHLQRPSRLRIGCCLLHAAAPDTLGLGMCLSLVATQQPPWAPVPFITVKENCLLVCFLQSRSGCLRVILSSSCLSLAGKCGTGRHGDGQRTSAGWLSPASKGTEKQVAAERNRPKLNHMCQELPWS